MLWPHNLHANVRHSLQALALANVSVATQFVKTLLDSYNKNTAPNEAIQQVICEHTMNNLTLNQTTCKTTWPLKTEIDNYNRAMVNATKLKQFRLGFLPKFAIQIHNIRLV